MYKILSFLSKMIIPILVIIFSVLVMLPESSIHSEVIRNDSFYAKVSKEIVKNIMILDDQKLAKIGVTFGNREIITGNKAVLDAITSRVDIKKIEALMQEQTELQLTSLEETLKNSKVEENPNNNKLITLRNFLALLYSYRFFILGIIILLLIVVLVLAMVTNQKHFLAIAGLYKSIAWNLAVLILGTLLLFCGLGFVGTLTRDFTKGLIGNLSNSIEILDLINWQWAKFVIYLLLPAIAFLILAIVLSIFFGVLSIFQKESKEINQLNKNLKNNNLDDSSNPETIDYSNIEYSEDELSSINTDPTKNNIINNSFAKTAIPEPKPREDLDPFLNRLNTTIGSTNINNNHENKNDYNQPKIKIR